MLNTTHRIQYYHTGLVMFLCVFLVLSLTYALTAQQRYPDLTSDFYIAAVVEYAPPHNPILDEESNILNNVAAYIGFIKQAGDQMADIIVFPEIGLIGFGNKEYDNEIPAPQEKVTPCLSSVTQDTVLTQLSCAARSYGMYVVVNLVEKYFNTSQNQTQRFNTNTVFDSNGTIIARYRKYNRYGNGDKSKSPLEYSTFTTYFGVTFGVFICFDIDFKEPAVTLAREKNIEHFVFSNAWISELPFLTAVQTQWSWAYGLDVVLLASGYNNPESGASGSGIYFGRKGAASYYMSETKGSRLLLSKVPKKISSFRSAYDYNKKENEIIKMETNLPDIQGQKLDLEEVLSSFKSQQQQENKTNLFLLRDHLDVYKTEVILTMDNLQNSSVHHVNASYVQVNQSVEKVLCHRSLCCYFKINMTTMYSRNYMNTTRGDDFTKYYYRLAVFDGVRTYSGFATAGVQACSIIPCVNESSASCGLRSDDSSAQLRKYFYDDNLIQSGTVFESIEIVSQFVYNNTFVFPDIFVTGTDDNYGALVPSDTFVYGLSVAPNGSAVSVLKTMKPINNLVSFAIYARQFDRDGEKEDEPTPSGALSIYYEYKVIFTLTLVIHFCVMNYVFW